MKLKNGSEFVLKRNNFFFFLVGVFNLGIHIVILDYKLQFRNIHCYTGIYTTINIERLLNIALFLIIILLNKERVF